MQQQVFQTNFKLLCEWHNKTPNPLVSAAYGETLRDLSDEEFIRACKYAIANHSFMPTAKQLYEAVKGTKNGEMHLAWEKALKACSRAKSLAESQLSLPACYAIERMGGLKKLGQTCDRDIPWRKKEFAELYVEAIALQSTNSLPALTPSEDAIVSSQEEILRELGL